MALKIVKSWSFSSKRLSIDKYWWYNCWCKCGDVDCCSMRPHLIITVGYCCHSIVMQISPTRRLWRLNNKIYFANLLVADNHENNNDEAGICIKKAIKVNCKRILIGEQLGFTFVICHADIWPNFWSFVWVYFWHAFQLFRRRRHWNFYVPFGQLINLAYLCVRASVIRSNLTALRHGGELLAENLSPSET